MFNSEGSTSEWRMNGRDLIHSSGDSQDFETLDYINKIIHDLGMEPLTSPVISKGYVYVANEEGFLFQFNASNSLELISVLETSDSIYSSPIVVEDFLYVGTRNGVIYKLNASNVEEIISVFETYDEISVPIIIANDYVYFGTSSGYIYQLNIHLNNIESVALLDYEVSSMAAAGEYIYIGTSEGVVYQVNATNLSNQISSYNSAGTLYSSIAVYAGNVYYGGGDGFVYQLNALNVSNLISIFDTGYSIYSSPAIFDDKLYIGNRVGNLFILNASNVSQFVDGFNCTGAIYSSPVIYQNHVFIVTDSGFLYNFNSSNLSEFLDIYDAQANIQSSPAIAEDYIYFGTEEGVFYQLNVWNFSLDNIDIFPPTITIMDSDEYFILKNEPDIQINAEITDENEVGNITIYLYNLSGSVLHQVEFFESSINHIFFGVENGKYVYEIVACDIFNNCDGIQRNVTISVEEQNISNTWSMFKKDNARKGADEHSIEQIGGLNQEIYVTGSAVISSPAVALGYVYVGSMDGYVYQLDASDISVEVSSFASGAGVYSSPAVALGYVYVGGMDGYIYQLSASNISHKLSEFYTGDSVLSSPAFAYGSIYVGSNSGFVYRLNASNINQSLSQISTGGWIYSSPAVEGGYVYVGSHDGILYQLDASNLSIIAVYDTGSNIDSSPAVADGYVYVGSNDGYIYQFNASNISRLIAKYNSGSDISSSPAVFDNYVYIGSMDGKLHQLNSSNISKLIANFTTEAPVQSSPSVFGGYVYVGTHSGLIFQLNSSNILFENYDAVSPDVYFQIPTAEHNSIHAISEILVNVTAEDYYTGVANITVFIHNSSGTLINYLISESDYAYANFTYMQDGQYYINATACDFNNNCNNTQTRAVFVDSTAPLIQIQYNITGINLSNSEIYVNLSIYDLALFNLSVYLFDLEGNLVNQDLSENDEYSFNFSNLSDGEYYIVIETCDELGNCNMTQYDNITIDTTSPDLDINITGNNITYDSEGVVVVQSSDIYLNLTLNDSALSNTSVYIYDEGDNLIRMMISPSGSAIYNFSNLPDGEYLIQVSACDYSGNCRLIYLRVIINTSSLNPVVITRIDSRVNSEGFSMGAGNDFTNCSLWTSCMFGQQTRMCSSQNETRSCQSDSKDKLDLVLDSSESSTINKAIATLFDINLGLLTKRVEQNNNLTMVVGLINLGIPGQVNTTLNYEIRDERENVVYAEIEIVAVETQQEFIKILDISKLTTGEYKLLANLEYEGQKEPAQAEVEFTIYTKQSVKTIIIDNLYLISLIMMLLAVIGLMIQYSRNINK